MKNALARVDFNHPRILWMLEKILEHFRFSHLVEMGKEIVEEMSQKMSLDELIAALFDTPIADSDQLQPHLERLFDTPGDDTPEQANQRFLKFFDLIFDEGPLDTKSAKLAPDGLFVSNPAALVPIIARWLLRDSDLWQFEIDRILKYFNLCAERKIGKVAWEDVDKLLLCIIATRGPLQPARLLTTKKYTLDFLPEDDDIAVEMGAHGTLRERMWELDEGLCDELDGALQQIDVEKLNEMDLKELHRVALLHAQELWFQQTEEERVKREEQVYLEQPTRLERKKLLGAPVLRHLPRLLPAPPKVPTRSEEQMQHGTPMLLDAPTQFDEQTPHGSSDMQLLFPAPPEAPVPSPEQILHDMQMLLDAPTQFDSQTPRRLPSMSLELFHGLLGAPAQLEEMHIEPPKGSKKRKMNVDPHQDELLMPSASPNLPQTEDGG